MWSYRTLNKVALIARMVISVYVALEIIIFNGKLVNTQSLIEQIYAFLNADAFLKKTLFLML